MTLPPNPDGINNERAAWAGTAIVQFINITGTDLENSLCYLLCDLMHWADRTKEVDFEADLERARYHYDAETEEAE